MVDGSRDSLLWRSTPGSQHSWASLRPFPSSGEPLPGREEHEALSHRAKTALFSSGEELQTGWTEQCWPKTDFWSHSEVSQEGISLFQRWTELRNQDVWGSYGIKAWTAGILKNHCAHLPSSREGLGYSCPVFGTLEYQSLANNTLECGTSLLSPCRYHASVAYSAFKI